MGNCHGKNKEKAFDMARNSVVLTKQKTDKNRLKQVNDNFQGFFFIFHVFFIKYRNFLYQRQYE